MATLPDKKVEKLQWFENHIAQWNTNAVAIGVLLADVTAVATKTAAARAAYNAQQAAMQTYKDAMTAFNAELDLLATAGTAIIKTVKAKAESTGNMNLYALAGLPMPVPPQSRGTPGTPTTFTATLNPDGSVSMAWKCSNAGAGTLYQVYRSVTGAGGVFTYVGGTGERKFTDSTIPVGSSHLMYKIQAVRTNGAGLFATFNVGFGGGGVQAEAPTATIKIAA